MYVFLWYISATHTPHHHHHHQSKTKKKNQQNVCVYFLFFNLMKKKVLNNFLFPSSFVHWLCCHQSFFFTLVELIFIHIFFFSCVFSYVLWKGMFVCDYYVQTSPHNNIFSIVLEYTSMVILYTFSFFFYRQNRY